jgi:hypothetical protein
MTPRLAEQAAEARRLLATWIASVPERCWEDDAFEGRVYGSGYSAWGLWAEINVAFVLASSLSWPFASQGEIPGRLRDPEERRELLAQLLLYVVGSHTTGKFETVGGGRWGGRRQAPRQPEHFENWHSPVWVTTLAQIATREPRLDPKLSKAIWGIVAHDAAVQASLPVSYLHGRADSDERHGYFTSEGGSNSHPESNAWKGSLLSLARFASPQSAQMAEFERTLWLSSSTRQADAVPDDRWIDGEILQRYQMGTHLSDSGAVIHHGVMHPCYSVFALFSRLQTHEFARTFDQPYPAEAERYERLILSTLLHLVLGGRLVYPSGQDWPRWIYGQCYLAPVLAHQQRKLDTDLSPYLEPAIEILLREARPRQPRLLGPRFEHLEAHHRWHYDRYETDLAYALALTAEILERTPTPASALGSTPTARFYDPAAQTAMARSDDLLISVSARTLDAPFEILIATASTAECLEWTGCGAYRIGIRDLPDLGVDRSTLESHVPQPENGFDAIVRTVIGISPQTDGLLELITSVRALPEQRSVEVVQRLTALRHTTLTHLDLHCWRFSHGQSGLQDLHFTDGEGRYDVHPGEPAQHNPAGNVLRLHEGPTFLASCRWRIRHAPDMTDPMTAARWTEVYIPVPVDPSRRFAPREVICEIPLVVTYSEPWGDQR